MLPLLCLWLAAAPPRPYVVEHYTAALTLDFNRGAIEGTETLRLHSTESIDDLELDANEIAVTSALIGKTPQHFSQSTDRLRIHLTHPLQPGKRLDLKLTFHGSPTKGLLFFPDQACTVYNTSHWLVVNHEPSNLATLTLSLNVPANMLVIANGENIANTTTRTGLISEWKETRAIPDFTFGFAVGPFTMGGTRQLRYFSSTHTPAQMEQLFHATPDALRFFSEKAGVPYPSKTYSQILAPGNPEQELGDFTLLPADPSPWLLAHELAHQWWGIGVACRSWSDFWLNEGIATFMADAFLGDNQNERARTIYEELKASGKDRPLSYLDWKSEKDAGGRLPYFKGAWVLHLLKQQIGEDAFWRGLQTYTRANWGKTVATQDLQSSMEKASGSNLSTFFDHWVYR